MDNNSNTNRGGVGIFALCFGWGLVTQALTWAGVLNWPWIAIWGPALLYIVSVVIALLIISLGVLIAALIEFFRR